MLLDEGGLSEGVSADDVEVMFGSIGRIAGIEFVRTSGPSFAYVGFHCPSHKVMTKFSTVSIHQPINNLIVTMFLHFGST